MNYYNEHDPKAAAWLRELIKQKLIPDGDVDERDIEKVKAHEIKKYTQHHFFAGIGGWPLALQIAGWPETQRVATGSCPCQPFSVAGKKLAEKDSRHVWPWFRELVRELEIPIVFGEQVASKAGRKWLSGVRAEMVFLGYIFGAADLCAAGVGAPHIRQRLFWVAESQSKGRTGMESECEGGIGIGSRIGSNISNGGMGDANLPRSQGRNIGRHSANQRIVGEAGLGHWEKFDLIPCRDGKTRRVESGTFSVVDGLSNGVDEMWIDSLSKIKEIIICYAKASNQGIPETMQALRDQIHTKAVQWSVGGYVHFQTEAFLYTALCELARELGPVINSKTQSGEKIFKTPMREVRKIKHSPRPPPGRKLQKQSQAKLADIMCKLSQVASQLPKETSKIIIHNFPTAHGIPGRVGLLRGYGNAIVPQIAAQFILASIEASSSSEKIIFQPELGME
jgi:DNA (cytosine-5)-methyltransferase 1